MSEVDTDKLTPEQKQALAQVEASLALQKTVTPSKHVSFVKYFVVGVMTALVLASMYVFMRAQDSL